MKFDVRTVGGQYKEVKVSYVGTTIETGLLDEKERRELAAALREAADDLMYGLDEAEE
jgi:hypothetical protein